MMLKPIEPRIVQIARPHGSVVLDRAEDAHPNLQAFLAYDADEARDVIIYDDPLHAFPEAPEWVEYVCAQARLAIKIRDSEDHHEARRRALAARAT